MKGYITFDLSQDKSMLSVSNVVSCQCNSLSVFRILCRKQCRIVILIVRYSQLHIAAGNRYAHCARSNRRPLLRNRRIIWISSLILQRIRDFFCLLCFRFFIRSQRTIQGNRNFRLLCTGFPLLLYSYRRLSRILLICQCDNTTCNAMIGVAGACIRSTDLNRFFLII